MINHTAAVSRNKNIRQNQDIGNSFKFNIWLKNHNVACVDSLRTIYQAPLSNLLTMFILGIALALPVLLYLAIVNINNNLNTWQQDFYQYTIYIDSKYTEHQAKILSGDIANWPEVDKIDFISKDAGLKELKTIMGLETVLDDVASNPLPVVLTVNLKQKFHNLDSIKRLVNKTNGLKGVNKVEANVVWLEKINKFLKLFSIMTYIFSLALGLAVLLVIANTIRLVLQNKQQDMQVYSLLGATSAYIRRPYLYGGIFYGLFAGVMAIVVANFLLGKLHQAVSELGFAVLFANNSLIGFNQYNILALLLVCSLLGWLGARITLFWQIRELKSSLNKI